jgi:hypothetical protein
MRNSNSHHLRLFYGWFWLVGAFLVLIARTGYFVSLDDVARSGYVPDDGLYYFQLSRNFAKLGIWTFDSVVSRTTGFHLLHAYVCAAMYWAAPTLGPHAAVGIQAVLSLVLTLLGYTVLALTLARRFGRAGIYATASVAVTGPLMSCITLGVEWPYVVLFSAATIWSFDRGRAALGFLFALLGSLSRSDFGTIAIACAIASFYCYMTQPGLKRRDQLRVGGAILSGAAVGLALLFAHTHAASGHWLQSSVRMKMLWGRAEPLSELLTLERHLGNIVASNPIAFAVSATLRRSPRGSFAAFAAAALAALIIATRLPSADVASQLRRRSLVVVGIVSMLGYVALYSPSPESVQLWYTSAFVGPSAVLMAAILEATFRIRRGGIAGIALVGLAVSNLFWGWQPVCAHQRTQLASALYLRHAFRDGRIGSFNAGYLAFYSGRTVVNLDGLVNDDVYPYAASANLACYVANEDIRYIVDWDLMFSNDWFERRGGYADGLLASALTPRHSFEWRPNSAFDQLVVYEVDRGRLKEMCAAR